MTTDFASRLQQETIGVQLSAYQLTTRRSMAKGQVAQVANLFNAEQDSVSGSRAAINRKHELVKPIYSLLIQARAFVKAHTMDYPEKGIRLIKASRVEWLSGKVREFQVELAGHIDALCSDWQSVKHEARERLGELYSEADYPASPREAYGLELSFPAIKPDDRLMRMHPEIYAAEQARIAARFDDAVKKAEAAAADELGDLLNRFITSLSEPEDGKRRVLRSSTVEGLAEFAERFKSLSIGSNQGLDELVAQVEQLATGLDVEVLRKADGDTKATLQSKLKGFAEAVDKLVIVRPTRELDLD